MKQTFKKHKKREKNVPIFRFFLLYFFFMKNLLFEGIFFSYSHCRHGPDKVLMMWYNSEKTAAVFTPALNNKNKKGKNVVYYQ